MAKVQLEYYDISYYAFAMPLENEIGPAAFAAARAAERARAAEARRQARALASEALERARAVFVEQAEASYRGGGAAAGADCDGIEAIAERLFDFFQGLEPALERLDVAREADRPFTGRPRRMRICCSSGELAERTAETVGEAVLSGPAGAVLLAAVRCRAAQR